MTNTLTKAEIVSAVSDKADVTLNEARNMVEFILDTMKTAITHDHALMISGFGKFEAFAKAARKGRNPQTSESITLGPRRVVVFRLSKKFRAELN